MNNGNNKHWLGLTNENFNVGGRKRVDYSWKKSKQKEQHKTRFLYVKIPTSSFLMETVQKWSKENKFTRVQHSYNL